MFEFSSGGRRVSPDQFFKEFQERAIEQAMQDLEERVHGSAASIVDPETGKHPTVFVRRSGETSMSLSTQGSPAFARELEKRLGVAPNSIASISDPAPAATPRVYLAHASEDKDALARPLAARMMADGIDVWFDEWEIGAGDSLRRKMEEGLGVCTHFLVLLTTNSLGKAWVEEEIDAGFVRAVGGETKFIGVRVGVEVKHLSPFLRARRCPGIALEHESEITSLLADIHGISKKPSLGENPRYVKSVPGGLETWSSSAVAVAEYLVRQSQHGLILDPQASVEGVAAALGMPEQDVRFGVMDLRDAGLIDETKAIGSDDFWPKAGLFVVFDKYFMDFDNGKDAVSIATWLVSLGSDGVNIQELADQFSEWTPRRLNSALAFLEEAKFIDAIHGLGPGPWSVHNVYVNDRTRRFVREYG